MIKDLQKYLDKMVEAAVIDTDNCVFMACDDVVSSLGRSPYQRLAEQIFSNVGSTSLILASPPLPVLDLLLRRTAPNASCIVPSDTETRTFLHDVPIVRKEDFNSENVSIPAGLLGQRKGILIEGVGLVALGSVTVEQAYINYSSLYHALFIKLLMQLLTDEQPPDSIEIAVLEPLLADLETPLAEHVADLYGGVIDNDHRALQCIDEVGRRTVALNLVDSFFGNVSCSLPGKVLVSQTGASLDELAGCIDIVPDDNSSTAGITASSELIAHRAIYKHTRARVILHGHPRFSVLLSLLCEETDCHVSDCWKECKRPRFLGEVPVVAGEVGAGGLAKNVPPVIEKGIAVVYGHGVFAIGFENFQEPLRRMIQLENWCRNQFLTRVLRREVK